MRFKIIAISYWLLAISLFLYSYTQVDLNLTLSQWSIWQVIQTSFQYIGWFERPLSTAIFLSIIFLFSIFYFLLLWFIQKESLTTKQFWQLLIPISLILLFSYNAFSYDLFNYMFDVRIFTLYHQNPYFHRALDFPQDPWINFMRWTHRTSPYGPVWLGLTIPLSFLGFQFFLPTLFLFKGLMVGGFLGTVYFIGKILGKINPSKRLFGMSVFALNPLVIIESLVSAHNDIVMIFLAVLAIYLLLDKKYFRAFLLLFLSIGIKFATIFLLPIFIIIIAFELRGRKINWERIFIAIIILMPISIVLSSIRTELQPWYLLWFLPFVSFLTDKKWLIISSFVLSLGLLLHYVPFLYTGNWDPPIPTIKFWLTTLSLVIGIMLVIWYNWYNVSNEKTRRFNSTSFN